MNKLNKLMLLFFSVMMVVSIQANAACPTTDPYCPPPGAGGSSYPLTATIANGGWNLIGYSGSQAYDTHTLLSQMTVATPQKYNVISAWKYDLATGGWYYFNPAIASAGFATTLQTNGIPAYKELTTISPGDGIWIRVREAMTLSMP
jgi:hypothetical protein